MNYGRSVLALLLLVVAAPCTVGADRFVPLFDGKTLAGWTPLPGGNWQVADGVIVGSQEKSEKRHGILLSDKKYGDFVVRLQFKALAGNSGFYFRADRVDQAVAVKGFQAEINADGKDVGGLYETLGRTWVAQPVAGQLRVLLRKNDWNEMTVAAIGGDVTVQLNGVTTARLKNDPGARSGFLGLQLHGGQKMNVLFKDIEIMEVTNAAQPVILEKIHDLARPLPEIVEPKSLESLREDRQAPAGAIVLLDGSNLDQWQGSDWIVKDGVLESRAGDLTTRRSFGDGRLHVEWRVVDADSHGNSGVYLMNQFEVQIFNSYHNHAKIYADGVAAAIYGQYPPLVNACRPPGQWEIFDIDFRGPRFDSTGKLTRPATVTMRHNGILVQDGVALTGPTGHKERPPYVAGPDKMPITLQYHGNPMQFRNIWFIETD